MDTGVKISIIAAVAENGVIGCGGEIPWRLQNDLKRFAELTRGHTVIVGRKTHEAILRRLGHPLKDRRTIILTKQLFYRCEGCEVADSWEEALRRVELSGGEVFVIGGAEVYRLAKPYADLMYLTEVHARPEGDAFFYFPEYYDTSVLWEEVSAESHRGDAENGHDYTFKVLRRKTPPVRPERHRQVNFVNLENARYDDQRAVMERIAKAGICPFCPENKKAGEVLQPLWRGKHWVLVPNRWPYRFTKLHLIAIPERHVRFPHELGLDEWGELHEVIAWTITAHGLRAGAIGIRFGDSHQTGASVDHLHVQILVADQDVAQPGYERVRFPMGPKPPEPKEEKAPGS